ncbi:beta-N-acetylhexosaminidase [Clostridium septicum]|uniref:beta-N-acetylhexosaminidase n=1 Tax=Clostridium septicum TaxID=1504 RepID=A0A9N7JKX7_CLOSE|nr:glycoside hydrolase family 20 zincin-like fold domain-containing protein [Clostridium septicum]AYE33954.1 glycosyl hydrolase family 20 [Clostridium septicum]QAS62105.1 glycosyl hydrolase family 20 [Clostridium septicum]UEC21435.1 family 20 glycosylhydrolase [Clostridium septicum]USS00518.1 family 20 glycosylhydrolase [Clostridium septicum]
MYLIPSPKKLVNKSGSFRIKRDTKIILNYNCDFNNFEAALILKNEIKDKLGFNIKINKGYINDRYKNSINLIKSGAIGNEEGYKLEINEDSINVISYGNSGLFYGIQTLMQIIRQRGAILPNLEIEDEPYFKNRGFYHDVTRGRVPKLETLKKLVDKAAFYKVNQIQLYIEHTFAFKDMSEVWVDKDPLTAEEILILDEYCKVRHIELIPSLATFGHLYEVLRTKSYSNLCELENMENDEYSFVDRMAHHTLDVSNDESLKLVKNMLNEFIPLFTSNKFNICGDETFDLGKGKSKSLGEEIGQGKLYTIFLNKIIDIVKGYDKEVMFWGDVILNHTEVINEIPKDVICLNWNYGSEATEEGTRKIYEAGREQYVCPGVAGWSHLMNLMDNGFENIRRMVSYGVKYKASGVLNTNWGDYGHINILNSSIPGMAYGGALSWNPNGEKDFETIYKALSIIEYGDNSLTIVSLLRDLGNTQVVSWSDLVRWKELFNKNSEVRENTKSLNPNKIKEARDKACEIEEKLTSLLVSVRDKKEIQEFIVCARGIILINEFFLLLLKYKFKTKNNFSDFDNNKLAKDFEEWFYDYSYIWRNTSKESELNRIGEVIKYTSKALREF